MSNSVRILAFTMSLLAVTACDDEPLTNTDESAPEPPPPVEGVAAFVQIDNEAARTGDRVRVSVVVQVPSGSDTKIGSYTGILNFDPDALSLQDEVEINDGMRVSNPNDAGNGVIRFAGASASGFAQRTLYEAVFEVRRADYAAGLSLEMQELSQASTLTDLQPQLQVSDEVFLSVD